MIISLVFRVFAAQSDYAVVLIHITMCVYFSRFGDARSIAAFGVAHRGVKSGKAYRIVRAFRRGGGFLLRNGKWAHGKRDGGVLRADRVGFGDRIVGGFGMADWAFG